MKRLKNRITTITIGIALLALGGLLSGISDWQATFAQSFVWVGLIILSIIGGILVIIVTIIEKRASKPDNSNATTETKDITTRFILREGPVTIEAPDAESAVKVYQGIHENLMKAESPLKATSPRMVEGKEPEDWQVEEGSASETASGVIQKWKPIPGLETLRQGFEERQQRASEAPETKENEE